MIQFSFSPQWQNINQSISSVFDVLYNFVPNHSKIRWLAVKSTMVSPNSIAHTWEISTLSPQRTEHNDINVFWYVYDIVCPEWTRRNYNFAIQCQSWCPKNRDVAANYVHFRIPRKTKLSQYANQVHTWILYIESFQCVSRHVHPTLKLVYHGFLVCGIVQFS